MEKNNSLSARIKRRNKQGFIGSGTGRFFNKDGQLITYSTYKAIEGQMGDYRDVNQNHKLDDYKRDEAKKFKVGYESSLSHRGPKNRQCNKKYADNHQKV